MVWKNMTYHYKEDSNSLLIPVCLWNGAPTHNVTALHITPTNIVVSGTDSGFLYFWQVVKPPVSSPSSADSATTSTPPSLKSSNSLILSTPQLTARIVNTGHDSEIICIRSLAYRGSVDAVVSLAKDGSLGVWNGTDGLCLNYKEKVISNIPPTSMCLLNDNQHVIIASYNHSIEIVDLFTMKSIHSFSGAPCDWICSLDNIVIQPQLSLRGSEAHISTDNQPQFHVAALSTRHILQLWTFSNLKTPPEGFHVIPYSNTNVSQPKFASDQQTKDPSLTLAHSVSLPAKLNLISTNGDEKPLLDTLDEFEAPKEYGKAIADTNHTMHSFIFPSASKKAITEAGSINVPICVKLSPDSSILAYVTSHFIKLYCTTSLKEFYEFEFNPDKNGLWAGASFVNANVDSNAIHILLWTQKGIAYLYEITNFREHAAPITSIASIVNNLKSPISSSESLMELNKEINVKLLTEFASGCRFVTNTDSLLIGADDEGVLRAWQLFPDNYSSFVSPLNSLSISTSPFAEGRLGEQCNAERTTGATASVVIDSSFEIVKGFANGSLTVGKLPDETDSRILGYHNSKIVCIMCPSNTTICPRGKVVISGAVDGTIVIWDMERFTSIAKFANHSAAITHLFVAPEYDNDVFFSVSKDNSIGIYSFISLACKKVLSGHTSPISRISLRLDHDYLMVGCSDCSLTIWELSTGLMQGRVFGNTVREVQQSAEDFLKERLPKTMHIKGVSSTLIKFSESNPSQILLLNIKHMLTELHNKLQSPIDSKRSSCATDISKAFNAPSYLALSYIIPWGSNKELDDLTLSDLKNLSPYPRNVSFGFKGAHEKISIIIPSERAGEKWSISPHCTALHLLSGTTLMRSLLYLSDKKACCSQLLSYFCGAPPQSTSAVNLVDSYINTRKLSIAEPHFIEPSLLTLAIHWRDPIDEVMYSARDLISSILNRKSIIELTSFCYSLASQLKIDGSNSKFKALKFIILGIIGSEKHDCLDNETASQVATALLKIMDDHSLPSAIQCAAIELLGKGYSLWSKALADKNQIVYKIFRTWLLAKTKQPKSTTATIAGKAMLAIGAEDPLLFVNFFTEEVLKKTDLNSGEVMIVLSSLIKKYPERMLPVLARLVDSIVRCLDPVDFHKREALIKQVTALLCVIVNKYPMISFHQASQRLAIGSGNLIHFYELKTGTRLMSVKHNGSVTALQFSSDGKVLASFSIEESKIICWSASASTSFWNLGGPSTPKVLASFTIAPQKIDKNTNLLEAVRLEWKNPKSFVLIRSWDAPVPFSFPG